MTMTPLETVEASYAASKAGDRDGFLALFSDDFEIIEAASLPYGGVYKGRDGFFELMGKIFSHFSKFGPEVLFHTAGGEWVMTYCQLSMTSIANGRSLTIPLAERWRVVDGKITLLHPIYGDTAAVLDLLDLAPGGA